MAFLDFLFNHIHRNIQKLADMLQRFRLIIGLLLQHHRIAGQIIHQLLPILVENQATGSDNSGLTQAIAIGLLSVIFTTPQLQIYHAPYQNDKKKQTNAQHGLQTRCLFFI